MKRCAHRWIEKSYRGQVCAKCGDERGHFLPGAKKPQWYRKAKSSVVGGTSDG